MWSEFLVRQLGDVASIVVLQIGISWESVFDILGNNIGDIFQSLVESQLNNLLDQFLKKDGLFEILLRTPAPKMRGGAVLFGTPSQPIWSNLRALYWTRFLPVGYLTLFISVMVSNFGRAWGLGGNKEKQRKIGLLVGLFLVPGAWYLAVAYLKLMNLVTIGIAPELEVLQNHTVEAFADVITNGPTYAGLVGSTSVVAFLLAMIVNLLRLVAVWVLVPTLPLALGFDLGEFPILGGFSRRAYSMFVVLGAAPIPIAIGFRIIFSFNKIVRNSGNLFYEETAASVFVILVPTLAALVPVYVFMQAADYATIRGASATLSIIGKPASLAVSGGSSAGLSALKSGASGGDDSADDNDENGEGGGGGGGSSAGQGSDGTDGDEPPALPKRKPSGSRSQREPSANQSSGGSTPPALPSAKDAPPTNSTGSAGGATTATGGTASNSSPSLETHADREMARSDVIANGSASAYAGGASGSRASEQEASGALYWREVTNGQFDPLVEPNQQANQSPEASTDDESETTDLSSASSSETDSREPNGADSDASHSQSEQEKRDSRQRRQPYIRNRYDGTGDDSQ